MALKKCKECGAEVSKKAKTCPHCGAPGNGKTSFITWFVLIVLVLVWLAVSGVNEGRKTIAVRGAGNGGAPDTAAKSAPLSWRVQQKRSNLDDSINVYLSLPAGNVAEGWLAKHRPVLMVVCRENKTEAFVNVGMQSHVDRGAGGPRVVVRLDDAKAQTWTLSESTDGEALFFPQPVSKLKTMMRHKMMLFRFTPHNASPQDVWFKIEGLEQSIGPLRKACNW